MGIFQVETGERIKKIKGHSAIINACSVTTRGTELLASGSDDGHLKIWDTRQKTAIKDFDTSLPILSLSLDLDGGMIYSASVDNVIQVHL